MNDKVTLNLFLSVNGGEPHRVAWLSVENDATWAEVDTQMRIMFDDVRRELTSMIVDGGEAQWPVK